MDDNDFNTSFKMERNDELLPQLNAFLWEEFKILGGVSFEYVENGIIFPYENQYNSLIFLLVEKSYKAISQF